MFRHTTHALLDAARLGHQIEEAKTRNKTHDSLYRGGSQESLSGVAPHIFRFAYPTPFSTYFLKKGWGDSWGILIKSSWPLSELHKHFRKFLLVKTEDGEELYFRFYDPRVLRIFLATCDAAQIREFFGGAIDFFIAEDEDPDYALRFFHQNGILKTERFSVRDEIAALPEPEPVPPSPEDPLPPKAVAALEAQGFTMADFASAPATGATPPKPAETSAVESRPESVPPVRPSSPATEATPAPPKPKTKWNTFE